MQRIKQTDLEMLVEHLNNSIDLEKHGAYHLSYAYGGVSLHQYIKPGSTAIHDTFRCGHVPKRDLYNRIQAFQPPETKEAGVGHCKDCEYWAHDTWDDCDRVLFDRVGDENDPAKFSYHVDASDDQGLEFRLIVGPEFGCVHFEQKQ
jgi:hypothetical protein